MILGSELIKKLLIDFVFLFVFWFFVVPIIMLPFWFFQIVFPPINLLFKEGHCSDFICIPYSGDGYDYSLIRLIILVIVIALIGVRKRYYKYLNQPTLLTNTVPENHTTKKSKSNKIFWWIFLGFNLFSFILALIIILIFKIPPPTLFFIILIFAYYYLSKFIVKFYFKNKIDLNVKITQKNHQTNITH